MLSNLDFFEWMLVISILLFAILSLLHSHAGIEAYIRGKTLGVFISDHWIPETSKQKTLLGVFFMITFSWWQSQIMLVYSILVENQLKLGFGIISLIFTIPQLLLLRIYINWNKIAQFVVLFHIFSLILWILFSF